MAENLLSKLQRIHLQWLGKAQSTEKGAQLRQIAEIQMSELQRGNTTEGTLQSHPKLRSMGMQKKPLLFLEPFTSYFSLRNGKKVSYREWSCTKDSRCNHPFLLKWKANSSTCFFQGLMMHRDAMFNHHASWGGIIKHLKRSF